MYYILNEIPLFIYLFKYRRILIMAITQKYVLALSVSASIL